MKINRIFL